MASCAMGRSSRPPGYSPNSVPAEVSNYSANQRLRSIAIAPKAQIAKPPQTRPSSNAELARERYCLSTGCAMACAFLGIAPAQDLTHDQDETPSLPRQCRIAPAAWLALCFGYALMWLRLDVDSGSWPDFYRLGGEIHGLPM